MSFGSSILITYLPGESPANLRDDMPLLTSETFWICWRPDLPALWSNNSASSSDVDETSVERFNRIQDIAGSVEPSRPQERDCWGYCDVSARHLTSYLEASAARYPDHPQPSSIPTATP